MAESQKQSNEINGQTNLMETLKTELTPNGIAKRIDHTLLKPQATAEEILKVCDEAIKHSFYGVCVNSSFTQLVSQKLLGTEVKTVVVVGFPLGMATSATKAFEARDAIRSGAQEIDMVINIGALKNQDYRIVFEDIKQVVDACYPVPVKVILETSDLTHEEKICACALSQAAGARFVKTSTGFSKGGATVEDVSLMKKIVGNKMEIKASGGVRSLDDAKQMIVAGASRLGTSQGVAIINHQATQSGY